MKKLNKVILICGVPGTGKSTIALKLADTFGIDQIASTDILREIMRSLIKKEKMPILFSTTHEAWKHIGEKNNENIIKGVICHARLIYPQIIHLIKQAEKEGRDIILEGVHLIPEIFDKIKNSTSQEVHYFLLHLKDKKEHFKRFDYKNEKRTIFHYTWYSNFENMKLIDNWLRNEAAKRGLNIIENNNLPETIKKSASILKNEILYVK